VDEAQQKTGKDIPLKERIEHVVLAVLLLAYGAFGLYSDDIYIPRRHSKGVHLHGTAVWVMCGAIACGVLNLLAVAVDHCDTSEGEKRYKIWARITQVAGWTLYLCAMFWGAFPRDGSRW
jgi:hypothetical protein